MLARFETALGIQDDPITGYSKLLPIDDLRRIVSEIEGGLRPAGGDAAAKWARFLVGAYPKKGKDGQVNDSKIFMHSLRYDLEGFPEDIIEQAVHEVRRTCIFFPTCAEVYQAADALRRERNALLRKAQAQIKEHERRQKERESTEKRYADLSPEEKKAFDDRLDKLKRQVGEGMRPDYGADNGG